ncbi:MAG: hypothetical protein NTX76_05610 [Alphaproteobacteria bacterium]|nr:hypothetical protein [Alphaproteobacteria bacterium]
MERGPRETRPCLWDRTATKTETVHQTIDLIKEEWKKFAEHGITQAELDFQKKNIIGGYPLTFGSTLDIVNALLCYRNDGLPIDYINKRNSYFEKLTVEDINSVIKKVFDPALLTFVVVGREAGPEKMQ